MKIPELRIGHRQLAPAEMSDSDTRGLIWCWEPPSPRANYVIACDPSYGIASWDRTLRKEGDEETDNCAIEVIRCGTRGSPDVQVAEYAAPIDPEDAAIVVNFLGRMYAGASEDEQALAIVEVHPGPGLMTQRDLMNKFGYTNLFIWQHLDSMNIAPTQSYGWYSSRQSRQMLWIRGTRHITKHLLTINSPALIEEMTDCKPDNFQSFTARAQWGSHDDRVVATLLAIWAANQWNDDNPPEEAAKPTLVHAPSAQASDMTYDEMMDDWSDRMATLRGEY